MKTDNSLETIMKSIAGLVLLSPFVVITLVGLWIWHGFVLQQLWGWFVVPTFAVPGLSLPIAIGLWLTAGLLARQHVPSKEGEAVWIPYLRSFLSPALVLAIGWCVTRFM